MRYFESPTDFFDPFIQEQFDKPGNWALYPIIPYHHSTLNYFAKAPNPAPPSADNWFGTDDRGRDVLARLLLSPQEMPVGVLTAVLGGGYLLFLMSRQRGDGVR